MMCINLTNSPTRSLTCLREEKDEEINKRREDTFQRRGRKRRSLIIIRPAVGLATNLVFAGKNKVVEIADLV